MPQYFPKALGGGNNWSHGYLCTVNCSGHEAGYQWAEEHGITDPSECSGNSTSFIEGCEAYAEENAGVAEDAE